MTAGPPSSRTEIRTAMKVLVELCSFDNITYEHAYTVDVSPHGARILTKIRGNRTSTLPLDQSRESVFARARCLLPTRRRPFVRHRRGIA